MLCLANQTPPFHPEDAFRPTASRPLTYQTLSGRFQPCRQGSVTGCSERRAVVTRVDCAPEVGHPQSFGTVSFGKSIRGRRHF